MELSTLINNILDLEKRVPLEFLINGQFLRRSTLDGFLAANGISAETTLAVEYVRAIVPPVHATTFEHDDWVSAVDVLSANCRAAKWSAGDHSFVPGNERILSASYDGLLRMWDASSKVLATSPSAGGGGHASSIKSVKFLSSTRIVSAAADRSIRVWKYSEASDDTSEPALVPTLELYGHEASVNSIDVHAPTSRIVSASSDHSVGLWSTTKTDAPAAPETLLPSYSASNKRRKINPSKSSAQRGPLMLLSSHTDKATAAIFAPSDPTVAYSSSWDHTVRTWDLTTGALVDTRATSHPLTSLCCMNGVNLLATGSTARHITLIDPRASATTIAALTLRGHGNAVVSLSPDPNGAYGLVSGSHDGTCKIWDIRSVKAGTGSSLEPGGQVGESVYTIPRSSLGKGNEEKRIVGGDGVKVFSVEWNADVGIVSAGEDKMVQINRPN